MSYCTEDDVQQRINKVGIKSGVDVSTFIADAESDIHMAAVTLYDIPFATNTGISSIASGVVSDILRDVTARRAAGRLILSATISQESDNIHAFAEDMIQSTDKFLQRLRKREQVLPGLVLDTDKSDDFSKSVSMGQSSPDGETTAIDKKSYFNRPYGEVGDKDNKISEGPIPPNV